MAGKSSVISVIVTGQVDKLKAAFGEAESRASKLAPAFAAAGVAAGAALTKGYLDSVDMGQGNAKLRGQLGLTEEEARTAGAVAGQLYAAGWGDSTGDINDAIRAVGQNLGDIGDMSKSELADVTTQAKAVADVFGLDVNEATRAAGQLLRNGLAPDAEAAFDIITAGMQGGTDRSGDFLDTLSEYAEPFSSLGLDAGQALGVLNAGLDAGAFNADKVGDALKEFSIRAVDGSKLSGEAYATLGLDADEMAAKIAAGGPTAQAATSEIIGALMGMSDQVAQDAAGVALFGSTWEDLGPQVIGALDPVGVAIEDVEGKTDELVDTVGGSVPKWEQFKRRAELALAGVGGALGPVLSMAPGVAALGGIASSVGGNFVGMATSIGKAGVAAGVATVKWAAHAVAATASAAASAAMTAAQWLLNAALSANPIALVVIAIAALVAGLVWAYNNVDWFRAGVDAAFGAVKSVISGVFNWVTDNWPLLLAILTGPIGLAVLAITTHWDTIKSGVTAVKDWVAGRFDDVVTTVTGLPGRISSAASGMWDGIKSAFRTVINTVIGWWNGLRFPAMTLPGVDLGPLGSIGGQTFGGWDLPNMRYLAKGGIVLGPTLAMVGEAGPEAVIPLTSPQARQYADRPAPIVVNVTVSPLANPRDVGREIDRVLRDYRRGTGR